MNKKKIKEEKEGGGGGVNEIELEENREKLEIVEFCFMCDMIRLLDRT